MSVRLYVGNLPKELERKELQEVFVEEGDTVSAKVITDRKTGKCRGFGFVTVQNDELADQIVEKYNGVMFKENALKIEKALPRKKGNKGEGSATNAEGGDEEQQQQPQPQPVKASNPPTKGANKNRKKGKKESGGHSSSSTSSNNGDAFQPDPRWASELEKLKQMLAAQAANP